MAKQKITKYVIWTDHKAGHYNEDKKIELEAQTLLEAIKEANNLCEYEPYLYCVFLYERVRKNEYKRIMRSSDSFAWYASEGDEYLIKHIEKISENITEIWFEVRFVKHWTS